MSDQQARPADASYFVRLGVITIFAIFGGLAIWSVLAPIGGAVIASGQIIVETNRKAVQHLEGGVISEILVREGDRVDAGEMLVRLDDTVQSANLALVDEQLTELYARRARLETERDEREEMATPRGVTEVLSADAFEAKLAGQLELLEARRSTRSTQIELLEERVVQQEERIKGLNSQIVATRDQRALIEEELEGVRELVEQGYAPKTRLRALEREARRLLGQGGALRASVAEATSIISEAKLNITRLQEQGREEAIAELRDAEVSIAELEERRVAAAEAFRRTRVQAPQAGRVMGLAIHTEGAVVAPGAPMMEIVPLGDDLQVALRVATRDIDKIQAGQDTLIRFSAFGARMTPEVDGTVQSVSADSFVDEKTGAPYYLVLVDIPQGEDLEMLLNNESVVPGMPVEAFIRTGSQPAISYFLKPLTDALARSMREE